MCKARHFVLNGAPLVLFEMGVVRMMPHLMRQRNSSAGERSSGAGIPHVPKPTEVDPAEDPLSIGMNISLHCIIVLFNLLLLQHVDQLSWGIISLNLVICHITVIFGFVGPVHGQYMILRRGSPGKPARKLYWWAPPSTASGATLRVLVVVVHFLGVGCSVFLHEWKACTHDPAVNFTAVPAGQLPTDPRGCTLRPDLDVVESNFDCAGDPAECAWREHWSFIDALYFCLAVVSTVGYGHELIPTSPAARSFTSFFAIVGVAVCS